MMYFLCQRFAPTCVYFPYFCLLKEREREKKDLNKPVGFFTVASTPENVT